MDRMTNKVEATVKRENGNIEVVDLKNYYAMNNILFAEIKKATAAAGRGNVLKITYTHAVSNANALRKRFNDLYNEGGEGYIPEDFTNDPEYKEWDKVEVFT